MDRWFVKPRDLEAEGRLVQAVGVQPITAALLVQRGLSDPEAAHKFLEPSMDAFHDPSLLPDYEVAVHQILGARERGETVFVHGDYDVDGVTSAALFTRFLGRIGIKVVTHVPHRTKEGYGIHANAVEAARQSGAKLFLTCDCGSGAVEQVKAAHEGGMAVVVTDHHTIGEFPAGAEALVNPHRADSRYPFKFLSGAGVALKLCAGITRDLGMPVKKFYEHYLDLAVLGTVADIMPLVDENRLIAKFGLPLLSQTNKKGLQALLQVLGLEKKALTSGTVGFRIGPPLNAAGRMDDAALALDLLLTKCDDESVRLADTLKAINEERRAEQAKVCEEVMARVAERNLDERWVIVVADPGWHPGIVGLAAGKVREHFNRPVFVGTLKSDGTCKASGRSIDNFDLAAAIRSMPGLMSGGGHAAAAGCEFRFENLEEIEAALDAYARTMLTEADLLPSSLIDLEVEAKDVTMELLQDVRRLEPFGVRNPTPLFLSRGVQIAERRMTATEHIMQLVFQSGQYFVKGVTFNQATRFQQLADGASLDLLFRPEINTFRGTSTVQFQVEDFAVV